MKAALGEHLDQSFRLWFTDHAVHGDPEKGADETELVGYRGILQQAVRDVSAWVEKGVAPPPSTDYKVTDGQIVVPATAAERKGVQPIIHLSANGGQRVEVTASEPVKFSAIVELPPHTGKFVAAEWDFEGEGTFSIPQEMKASSISGSRNPVTLTVAHAFSKPGTYFPALRATSQRDGDASTPFARISNLGRVRVVVR